MKNVIKVVIFIKHQENFQIQERDNFGNWEVKFFAGH